MTGAAQLTPGWTPIRFYRRAGRPLVDWCHTGTERFTDPFFDQTIERILSRPFNLLFRPQTPVAVLAELAALSPGLRPTGFIFHMSRCGSTVISRALATLRQNVVVSEANAIDSIMRANFRHSGPDDERGPWLQWLISALGRRRHAEERQYFVKFDGWHALNLPLVRRTYPNVPWLFVYREPVEVIASQLRRTARWLTPGDLHPRLLGLDLPTVSNMQREEYCARVLAQLCAAALRHAGDGRVMLLNHRQLPAALMSALPRFFGITYTAAELEALRRTAQFHAKEPATRYVDDAAAKRLEATAAARQAAGQWLGALYEQLEAARAAAPTFDAGPTWGG